MKRSFLFIATLMGTAAWAQVKPNVQEGQFTFDTDKPFTLLELDQFYTFGIRPERRAYSYQKEKA